MRVETGRGQRAPAPKRMVPCMQTVWPHMLVPRPSAAVPLVFPFDQPGLWYRYFARNAVWDAAQLLGLTGKAVLMPAYHHGVELETLLAAGATRTGHSSSSAAAATTSCCMRRFATSLLR